MLNVGKLILYDMIFAYFTINQPIYLSFQNLKLIFDIPIVPFFNVEIRFLSTTASLPP